MRPGRRDLTRLVDLAPEDDPAKVALLIRSARQAPDEPLPLVKWRIQNTLRRRAQWNRRGLQLALVGALVFLVGGVVGAIAEPHLRSRVRPAPPEPTEAPASAQAVRHTHRRMPVPAIPAPPADEPLVATEPSVLPAPAVALETKPTSKTAIPAGRLAMRDSPIVPAGKQNIPPEIRPALPIQPDPLANLSPPPISPDPHVAPPPNEHALLTTALRRLRTEHDPLAALAALNDYRLRFPSGGLAPEAAMLRAEAFLQIGRKGDALDELDRLSLGHLPNSDERYVLRGELRAAVGRWREALGDFDIVLRGHAEERAETGAATDMKLRDRLERALWGRALARSRLGNDAGARADLHECLRRFPRGRFASEATRLLGGHR